MMRYAALVPYIGGQLEIHEATRTYCGKTHQIYTRDGAIVVQFTWLMVQDRSMRHWKQIDHRTPCVLRDPMRALRVGERLEVEMDGRDPIFIFHPDGDIVVPDEAVTSLTS